MSNMQQILLHIIDIEEAYRVAWKEEYAVRVLRETLLMHEQSQNSFVS